MVCSLFNTNFNNIIGLQLLIHDVLNVISAFCSTQDQYNFIMTPYYVSLNRIRISVSKRKLLLIKK